MYSHEKHSTYASAINNPVSSHSGEDYNAATQFEIEKK